MSHVVLFDRLAFQKHKLDAEGNETVEPDGPEVIVHRGHPVPEWVSDWQLQALSQSGMIVPVADAPEPVAVPDDLGPPAPVAPVPDDSPPAPVALKPTDSRADWEAYATSDAVGMTEEEAAAFPNKQALIDAVGAKTAEK